MQNSLVRRRELSSLFSKYNSHLLADATYCKSLGLNSECDLLIIFAIRGLSSDPSDQFGSRVSFLQNI